jgi:hypothetical protein
MIPQELTHPGADQLAAFLSGDWTKPNRYWSNATWLIAMPAA